MRTWQRYLTALVVLGVSSSCGATDDTSPPQTAPPPAQWINSSDTGNPANR